MDVVVRSYRPSDREALIWLWHACGLVRAVNNPSRDIDRKLAHDAENLIVLEDEGQVVASVMVGYEGHRGWLNYLAVAPDRRGTGLGRMIVEEAERRLRAAGCAKVNLQIRTSNATVIGFYRRLGYEVEDVIGMGKRFVSDE